MMSWDKVATNWKQVKGKIKERWGRITDEQLDNIAGKRDALVAAIQQLYGFPKEDAERQVMEWEKTAERLFGAPADQGKELRRKVG